MWYSQNDPAWSNVNLGFGPGKIGPFGCLLTAFANLGHFVAGGNTNPPGLSGFLMNLGRFVITERNPDGSIKEGDLLSDNGLDGLFDCHYVETKHYEGVPADLNYPQDASDQQYIVEIDASPTAGVQTHFVLYYDGHTAANFRIVDSWDGQVKYLKTAYGDPATIIQKFIHYKIVHPAPVSPPPPAPLPEPPAPIKTPPEPATEPSLPPVSPPVVPPAPPTPLPPTPPVVASQSLWDVLSKFVSQIVVWLKSFKRNK